MHGAAVSRRLSTWSLPRIEVDRTVVAIVVLACAARLIYLGLAAIHGLQINDDGAQYLRGAENLRSGHGFVGVRGTPLTLQPPLYSLLVWFTSYLTGGTPLAGRLISIVAGALLPIPVFVITKLLFGRIPALIAATGAAFMPLFVGLSILILTDPAFITIALAGLAAAMVAHRRNDWRQACLAGAFFGFAYLLHPEGLPEAIAVAVVLGTLALLRNGVRSAVAQCAGFAVALAIVATPYIAILSHQSGHLAFQGKMDVNYFIGLRLERGMSYLEAAQGITDDARAVGPELDAWVEPRPPTLRERAAFALRAAPHQAYAVVRTWVARTALTPAGLLLVVMGLMSAFRGRGRARLTTLVLALAATMFLALLSVMHYWDRYGTPLLALTLPWAGKGAFDLLSWIAVKRGAGIPGRLMRRRSFAALIGLLALWLVVVSYPDVRAMQRDPNLPERAGLWLRAHDQTPGTVAEHMNYTAYYAGATSIALPYTTSSGAAVAYIAKMRPRYVELYDEPQDEPWAPYVRTWIKAGIPDGRATLIYRTRGPRGEIVQLYRWH